MPVTTAAAEIEPCPPVDKELENHTTKLQIPDQWSEGTMECIAKQVVTPAVRRDCANIGHYITCPTAEALN